MPTLRERAQLAREFVKLHESVHDVRRRTASDVCIAAFLVFAAFVLLFPAPLAAFALLGGAVVVLRPWHVAAVRRDAALPRIVRAWYPFIVVPLLYALVPRLNVAVHGGSYFDDAVQQWEHAVFGSQPAAWLADAAPMPVLSEVLHAAYLSYYLLIWLPALILYLTGRMRGFEAARLAFVASSIVCFVAFVLFPVQGPRYLWPAPGADGGWVYRVTHAVLERGSSRGAAFPSGHVAVAVAQSVVAWRFMRRHFLWIAPLSALLAVSTVYGGFHYAVDALAGAAVGGLAGWLAVRHHERATMQPPPTENHT